MVEEAANPALFRVPGTIMTRPRRGKQDKAPWRDLDLTAITERAVEAAHVFDVYLGESVAPYATLPPLKAALPIVDDGIRTLPARDRAEDIGGLRVAALRRLMRDRWETISGLWNANKALANRLTLLGQLDYRRKLSRQIEWRAIVPRAALRVVYGTSGRPTAGVLHDRDAIVDHTLYWIRCDSETEAAYLLAVINSDALRDAVEPLMPKGQWGARHVHKHPWALPIPRFNPNNERHAEVAAAGEAAAAGAARQLDGRDALTSATARKLLRQWLADSPEGREVERAVGALLAGAD